MKYIFFAILFFFAIPSFSQEVTVVSHYPESAFVENRMLPFTVQGESVQSVISVITQGNDSCSTMVDPYYNTIFHLYCREEGVVDLAVTIASDDLFDSFISINNLRIRMEAEPGQENDEEDPFNEDRERPF